MKHLALGWACNLNDLIVRFPYEKYKSLKNKTKSERKRLVKNVIREGIHQILVDIIENNVTFKIKGFGYLKGEIHMEPITGELFKKLYSKGKFKGVDFLESVFTGYQMYLYTYGKRDSWFSRKKYPIYLSKMYKDQITKNTNEGKVYG